MKIKEKIMFIVALAVILGISFSLGYLSGKVFNPPDTFKVADEWIIAHDCYSLDGKNWIDRETWAHPSFP
jgi:hypothetical protein